MLETVPVPVGHAIVYGRERCAAKQTEDFAVTFSMLPIDLLEGITTLLSPIDRLYVVSAVNGAKQPVRCGSQPRNGCLKMTVSFDWCRR